MSLAQTLQVNQLIVAALIPQKVVVRTALNDLALVKHVDDVGLLDRAETVRHGDGGSAAGGRVQGCLDDFLGLGVEC